MKTYRYRGTVEALRWTGTDEDREAFTSWFEAHGATFETTGPFVHLPPDSRRGRRELVAPGDWVVRLLSGFSPMSDATFGATYEGPLASLDLGSPVEVLELSARPLNALLNARIATLEDLTARSADDLRRVKNLGKIGLREVEERLEAVELGLRPPELDATANSRLEGIRRARDHRMTLAAFDEARDALRRLWETIGPRGYVARDWQDWQTVDRALRRFAIDAAKSLGINEIATDIPPADPELFPPQVSDP